MYNHVLCLTFYKKWGFITSFRIIIIIVKKAVFLQKKSPFFETGVFGLEPLHDYLACVKPENLQKIENMSFESAEWGLECYRCTFWHSI